MKEITHLVVHYSATYPDQDIGVKEIDAMHRARGFREVGYNAVNRTNGVIEKGREDWEIGAHVKGQNSGKLGICNIGGLDRKTGGNVGVDTRTPEQKQSLITWLEEKLNKWPRAIVLGHRDLANTQCPGYDAGAEWLSIKGERVPRQPIIDPAKAPTVTEGYIKKGSKGKRVMMLQSALNILGFYVQTSTGQPLKVDGVFGPETERAVKDFQRNAKIDVDGLVGPEVWTTLFREGGIH